MPAVTASATAACGESLRRQTSPGAAAEGAVDSQLLMCRALAHAIGTAISALSEAGQGLQHGASTALDMQGISFEERLKQEEPLVERGCRGLVGACRSLGVTLIGLAAVLSGDVLAPLKDLRRCVEAERTKRKEELSQLHRHEMLCSNALTESLQKKDKAQAELQVALRERAWLEKEGAEKKKSIGKRLAILTRSDAASVAEIRLQKAASSQTSAVEELAVRTEEAAIARIQAEQGAEALCEFLARTEKDPKRCLHTSIARCATAWVDVARDLQQSAEQLRTDAQQLEATFGQETASRPSAADSAGRGRVASTAAGVALPVRLDATACEKQDEDTDSPFAAPASYPASPSGRGADSTSSTAFLPRPRRSLCDNPFSSRDSDDDAEFAASATSTLELEASMLSSRESFVAQSSQPRRLSKPRGRSGSFSSMQEASRFPSDAQRLQRSATAPLEQLMEASTEGGEGVACKGLRPAALPASPTLLALPTVLVPQSCMTPQPLAAGATPYLAVTTVQHASGEAPTGTKALSATRGRDKGKPRPPALQYLDDGMPSEDDTG